MTFGALDASAWEAIGTWTAIPISVGLAIVTLARQSRLSREAQRDQAREAQDALAAQSRPFVVVDFDVLTERPLIFLTITNLGKTLARKVRFQFEPPLRSSLGQAQTEQVYMRHPDVEGTGGPTTREALEQVWKEKGWYEVPPPPVDDAVSDIPLLSQGMPTLAPGKTIPVLFDSFISRKSPYPDAHTVRISYDGDDDRHYEDTILLDLGVYRNIQYVKRYNVHDIHAEVKQINATIKKWSSSFGGLKVLSPTDEDKEHEDRESSRAERLRLHEEAVRQAEAAKANGTAEP